MWPKTGRHSTRPGAPRLRTLPSAPLKDEGQQHSGRQHVGSPRQAVGPERGPSAAADRSVGRHLGWSPQLGRSRIVQASAVLQPLLALGPSRTSPARNKYVEHTKNRSSRKRADVLVLPDSRLHAKARPRIQTERPPPSLAHAHVHTLFVRHPNTTVKSGAVQSKLGDAGAEGSRARKQQRRWGHGGTPAPSGLSRWRPEWEGGGGGAEPGVTARSRRDRGLRSGAEEGAGALGAKRSGGGNA